MQEVLYLGVGEILPPPTSLAVDPFDNLFAPTLVDDFAAEDLRLEVEGLLDAIHKNELKLATSYVRLGNMLLRVRNGRFWADWGFLSWGTYVDSMRARINRGRSQVYQVISVAEKLLPMIEASVLEEIGISKAGELKRFVTLSGRRITPALLALACDEKKGAEELRAAIYEEMHAKVGPKGKYMDLGGCFASDDERKEIERAFEVARRVDPAIPKETPEPQAKLEIMLRLSREFLGTWESVLEEEG